MLVHFESSFAQCGFNAAPEGDQARMQHGAIPTQIRFNGIGGPEIGGRAAGRKGVVMTRFPLLGGFLGSESRRPSGR